MEVAIITVTCIALIVLGGMTMAQGFLSSVDSTALGVETISNRDVAIARTELSPLSVTQLSTVVFEVALANSGQTKLNDFSKWDVIVQYYDDGGSYHVRWLPYIDGALGDNEWTVEGIYLNAGSQTPEVFEPEILNAGEEIAVDVRLNPAPGNGTTGDIIVSAPNGVSASVPFTVE